MWWIDLVLILVLCTTCWTIVVIVVMVRWVCYSLPYSVGSLPIEVDKSIPDNIGSPNEPPPPLPPK